MRYLVEIERGSTETPKFAYLPQWHITITDQVGNTAVERTTFVTEYSAGLFLLGFATHNKCSLYLLSDNVDTRNFASLLADDGVDVCRVTIFVCEPHCKFGNRQFLEIE